MPGPGIDQDPVDLPAADHLLPALVQHVDRPHRLDPSRAPPGRPAGVARISFPAEGFLTTPATFSLEPQPVPASSRFRSPVPIRAAIAPPTADRPRARSARSKRPPRGGPRRSTTATHRARRRACGLRASPAGSAQRPRGRPAVARPPSRGRARCARGGGAAAGAGAGAGAPRRARGPPRRFARTARRLALARPVRLRRLGRTRLGRSGSRHPGRESPAPRREPQRERRSRAPRARTARRRRWRRVGLHGPAPRRLRRAVRRPRELLGQVAERRHRNASGGITATGAASAAVGLTSLGGGEPRNRDLPAVAPASPKLSRWQRPKSGALLVHPARAVRYSGVAWDVPLAPAASSRGGSDAEVIARTPAVKRCLHTPGQTHAPRQRPREPFGEATRAFAGRTNGGPLHRRLSRGIPLAMTWRLALSSAWLNCHERDHRPLTRIRMTRDIPPTNA